MAVEMRIPTILRTFTGGAKAVEGDAGTLPQVIDGIKASNPGLKERLIEAERPAPLHQRLRQRRGRPVLGGLTRRRRRRQRGHPPGGCRRLSCAP